MFDSNDSGLFGQARMRRNMGVSTQGPVMETKRVGPNMPGGVNDPRSKSYNPNGSMNLEVGPGNGGGQTGGLDPVGPTGGLGGAWGKGEGGGFGGAGGPMPVGPRFGTPPGTGGLDPVGPGGGLGGPWDPNPMKGVDWQTVNGNTFANVRPGFSDPYAASQAVKSVNQSNPNWVDTGNGNGYVDVRGAWARQHGLNPRVPGSSIFTGPTNTGVVPPNMGGPVGGPGSQPRPWDNDPRIPPSTLWRSDSPNVAPREINPAMLNYLMTRNG